MPERVSSRDVFKPNAQVSHAFAGTIVGGFHRCGPDPWDDYEYRAEIGETITIVRDLRVQVEDEGPCVRLRHHGQVVVVEWRPHEDNGRTIDERRADFLAHYLGGYAAKPGIGPAAAIARLLQG